MKLPAPRGGVWDRLSILRLIEREAPDRLPRRAPNGRREESATVARLAKMLVCHCGRTLTPNVHRERRPGRGSSGSVNYYCSRGHAARADHPRVYVAESTLMPWIRAEADRFRVPVNDVLQDEQDAGQRATIEAKRQRVIESYIEGLIAKPERDRRLADLDRLADHLDTRQRLIHVPPAIDWTWPPKAINDILRALWERVTLDEQLRPVSAEWRLPTEYIAS